MRDNKFFNEAIIKIALPITLQSLFQASFGVMDQIMTGQLGEVNVAAIGLSGKFTSLFSVVAAAVATAAGIMISQYVGNKEEKEVSRSFFLNTILVGVIAVLFTGLSIGLPNQIMSIYTKDISTVVVAGKCLRILGFGFIPVALSLMLSTLLRCEGYTKLPLYASVTSAVLDTLLNYIMIFGKLGCAPMGIVGATLSTTISRIVECVILIVFLISVLAKKKFKLQPVIKADMTFMKVFTTILVPILICEFLWSLGENCYAIIYGHVSTAACAAMQLTNPVQSLMIGALTGVASAAGIYIGKQLGSAQYDKAYEDSKKFIKYGLIGSMTLSLVLVVISGLSVKLFDVSSGVQLLGQKILYAYAVVAPLKVLNMILGGGIIRSGGKTKYVMFLDIIGTWGFGVPIGFIAARVLHLPIYWIYFFLSLEEGVRLILAIIIFKRKVWMSALTSQEEKKDSSVISV